MARSATNTVVEGKVNTPFEWHAPYPAACPRSQLSTLSGVRWAEGRTVFIDSHTTKRHRHTEGDSIGMGIRALCLANDTNSYDLTHLFAKYCDEFQVVNTLAQATAIFSKSLDVASSLPHIGLIVADIPAGGINLAEYVLGRIRPNAYFALQHRAPNFVVFDPAGDINAARRALQLGVTEYLLPADLNATYLDNLITQLDFSSFETRASGVDAHAGLHPPTGNNNAAVPGLRLSSVEAAIVNCLTHNNGEPMSARSIVHAVLGRDVDEDRAASLIRPHISRLRSKVEPTPQMPQRLLTIRGKGYVLVQG